ncbi:hypothetical protein KJ786_00200 [Patescibacteria group bacterium]|nr:hypothetical protein [Patescibacteria group bacterium]
MKLESPNENQIKKDEAYWKARQNLFGFFSLLLEVDMRVNPHLYKNKETKEPKKETEK